MLLKLFFVLMICLIASSIQSCASVDVAKVDVKKMTYKALRQHDCRVNELNAFCERGFSNEYEEYERMREQFLRNEDTDDNGTEDTGSDDQQTGVIRTSFKLDSAAYSQ